MLFCRKCKKWWVWSVYSLSSTLLAHWKCLKQGTFIEVHVVSSQFFKAALQYAHKNEMVQVSKLRIRFFFFYHQISWEWSIWSSVTLQWSSLTAFIILKVTTSITVGYCYAQRTKPWKIRDHWVGCPIYYT